MKLRSAFLIILLLSCLVVFFYLQTYSTLVEITFGDYLISVNSIFLCLVFLICLVLLIIVMRIASLPFQVVERLLDRMKVGKQQNLFKHLLQAGEYVIVGEANKAQKIVQNILDNNSDLPKEIDHYLRLLFLKTDLSFNIKLHYLQNLLHDSSKYKFIIARDLSKLALKDKAYHYSLEFGLIAFETNSHDAELLELLIEVYATLESWNKISEMALILKDVDYTRFCLAKEKISNYYLHAAKHFIGLGEVSESSAYLKKCLEFKPDSQRCIELIANIHHETRNLDLKNIIEKAFVISPSFKLFKIYYGHYKNFLLAEEIYNNLVGAIDKQVHIELAIAIAYFLNMKRELDQLVLPLV